MGDSVNGSGIGSGGLGSLINTGLDTLQARMVSLKEEMAAVSQMDAEDQNVALINLQFGMGQYNALVELSSSITKSLSDSIKSVSQKV